MIYPFRCKNQNYQLASVYFDRAGPFIKRGEHLQAVIELTTGIELDQRSGMVYLYRGNAYFNRTIIRTLQGIDDEAQNRRRQDNRAWS